MTITFERTLDDLIHFNKYHMRHSPAVQRNQRQQLLIAFPAIAVIMIYVFRDDGLPVMMAAVLGGCLSSVLFNKWYVSWCLNRLLKRFFAEGHQKGLVGPHEIQLSTAGIHERAPLNESRTAWPAVERIAEDERYLFIYIQPAMAHVIPKTAFRSPEVASRFVAEARTLWDASKRTAENALDVI